MSVRIGESWTTRDGHRHWVSASYGHHYHGLGFGLWAMFAFPFVLCWWLLLAELWVAAEAVLLAVTAIITVTGFARRQIRPGDVTLTWLRWGLFIFDVKGSVTSA